MSFNRVVVLVVLQGCLTVGLVDIREVFSLVFFVLEKVGFMRVVVFVALNCFLKCFKNFPPPLSVKVLRSRGVIMHYGFVEFLDMSTRDLRQSINVELNSDS